eukprot:101772_1
MMMKNIGHYILTMIWYKKKILGRVGGYEFLRGLGFKQGMEPNELIVEIVDTETILIAIKVLNKKISHLQQTRNEWDPKWGKKKPKNNVKRMKKNNAPKQGHAVQVSQQEMEQQQIEEAIRLSQQQHVQDMLARQERALQFAKQSNAAKSRNFYQAQEEDDHKAELLN